MPLENTVTITAEHLEHNVLKLSLAGRLDLEGVNTIDDTFTQMIAYPTQAVLIDMQKVNFLASFGIRLLLINAKALYNRGGKMALYNVEPNIAKVLEISGLDKLIPVHPEMTSAQSWISSTI